MGYVLVGISLMLLQVMKNGYIATVTLFQSWQRCLVCLVCVEFVFRRLFYWQFCGFPVTLMTLNSMFVFYLLCVYILNSGRFELAKMIHMLLEGFNSISGMTSRRLYPHIVMHLFLFELQNSAILIPIQKERKRKEEFRCCSCMSAPNRYFECSPCWSVFFSRWRWCRWPTRRP